MESNEKKKTGIWKKAFRAYLLVLVAAVFAVVGWYVLREPDTAGRNSGKAAEEQLNTSSVAVAAGGAELAAWSEKTEEDGSITVSIRVKGNEAGELFLADSSFIGRVRDDSTDDISHVLADFGKCLWLPDSGASAEVFGNKYGPMEYAMGLVSPGNTGLYSVNAGFINSAAALLEFTGDEVPCEKEFSFRIFDENADRELSDMIYYCLVFALDSKKEQNRTAQIFFNKESGSLWKDSGELLPSEYSYSTDGISWSSYSPNSMHPIVCMGEKEKTIYLRLAETVEYKSGRIMAVTIPALQQN